MVKNTPYVSKWLIYKHGLALTCVLKLLIDFQISTAAPLKFGNGWVISSTLYSGCDYLAMLGCLKLIYVSKVEPRFFDIYMKINLPSHYSAVISGCLNSSFKPTTKKTPKLVIPGYKIGCMEKLFNYLEFQQCKQRHNSWYMCLGFRWQYEYFDVQ